MKVFYYITFWDKDCIRDTLLLIFIINLIIFLLFFWWYLCKPNTKNRPTWCWMWGFCPWRAASVSSFNIFEVRAIFSIIKFWMQFIRYIPFIEVSHLCHHSYEFNTFISHRLRETRGTKRSFTRQTKSRSFFFRFSV